MDFLKIYKIHCDTVSFQIQGERERKIRLYNLPKWLQSTLPKKLVKSLIIFTNVLITVKVLLFLNLRIAFRFLNFKRLIKPAVLFINIVFIVNLLLFYHLLKGFWSINFRKLVKPVVLFLSVILIVSLLPFLAAMVVQYEPQSNKAITINSFGTNSSTSTPIPTPTTTKASSDFTGTFIPRRPFTPVFIPDQTQDPALTPTTIPSLSPTSTPNPDPTVTPTLTPTPTPNPTITALPAFSTNLEPLPDAWGGYSLGYGIIFTSVIPPSQPQITALDTGVLFDGQPSIRLDRYVSPSENTEREVNGNTLTVSPGDHIVFSCWMKTSSDSLGYDGIAGYGARIGVSFYDSRLIADISWTGDYTLNPSYQQIKDNYVPWNTGSWTLRTLDFVVPSAVYDSTGVAHTPTAIIPWMQATPVTDAGSAWFAEPTVYINN